MSTLLDTSPPPSPMPRQPLPSTSTPPFQARSYQHRRSILGIETELLIQTYTDRILVILTQNGKVGCLTQASLPLVLQLPTPQPDAPTASPPLLLLPPPPPAIALTPLLGSPPDQTLHELYVSQIATLVWWALQEVGAERRAVVVGLTLEKRPRRGLGNGHTTGVKGNGGDTGLMGDRRDEYIDQGEEGEEGEEGEVGEDERERFRECMELVVGWPGPG